MTESEEQATITTFTTLNKKIEKLTEKLINTKNANKSLKKDLKDKSTDLKRSESNLEQTKKANDTLQEEWATLNSLSKTQSENYEILERKNKTQGNQINQLQIEFQSAITISEEVVTDLQKQIELLKEQNLQVGNTTPTFTISGEVAPEPILSEENESGDGASDPTEPKNSSGIDSSTPNLDDAEAETAAKAQRVAKIRQRKIDAGIAVD